MKTFLFAVMIMIAFFLNSCTKEERELSPSTYFIKATIDGAEVMYTAYTASVNKQVGLFVYLWV